MVTLKIVLPPLTLVSEIQVPLKTRVHQNWCRTVRELGQFLLQRRGKWYQEQHCVACAVVLVYQARMLEILMVD